MIQLFSDYSVGQIIIFLIVSVLAIKECIEVIEFFYSRSKNHFEDEFDEEQEREDMKKDIQNLHDKLKSNDEKFDAINEGLNDIKNFCQVGFEQQNSILSNLVSSDKDNIKSFIVKEYHYFVDQKKWIDDFSLDALERRYEHYVKEGGNSYVEHLMDEIRALPKHPIK